MQGILAGIMSLMQHKESQKLKQQRLERCLCCGRSFPWLHGCYPRKADRSSNQEESLNPILIQRYYWTLDKNITFSLLGKVLLSH